MMVKNIFSTIIPKRHSLNGLLFILVIVQPPPLQGVEKCPSGFQLKWLHFVPYCYKKKEPESFFDKFVNCPGNHISYGMFKDMNLTAPTERMWAEYKTLYPGGVFVDWSTSRSRGDPLESLAVHREGDVNLDEEYCLVVDPVTNFTMVRCDERYYRYCVIKLQYRSDHQEQVSLTVKVNANNSTEINLFVNYTTPFGWANGIYHPRLDKGNITCFTDSSLYPAVVSITGVPNNSSLYEIYKLTPRGGGYYWCTHSDPLFYKSESNKALYINESEVSNEYAVRMKFIDTHPPSITVGDIELMNRTWQELLTDYGSLDRWKLKRWYFDAKTILVHIKRDDSDRMIPVPRGRITIENIKPTYYCDKEIKFKLGDSYTTSNCMFHKCDGNYNDGVEIISFKLGPDKCTAQNRLDMVVEEMEKLLNSTDSVTTNTFGKIFSTVDALLALDGLKIRGNFLRLLDDLIERIDLNRFNVFNQYQNIQKNIALVVADALPESPVKGFQLADTGTDSYFTNDTITILKEITTNLLSTNVSEVVVSLPDYASTSGRRISFMVFRDSRAFQEGQEQFMVNSKVISVKVENLTMFPPGEVVDMYLKPLVKNNNRNENRICAFWKYNDDTGSWSQKGCNFTSASQEGLLDICRCDHLTHFAEILIRTGFPEEVEAMLERLSIIGCCVSIFGLLLVALTAALFHSWRRDFRNKIFLQLCASILIMSICFLVVVFANFQDVNILCVLTGVALHYSVLSSFCWMLVAAIISYRRLVLVFSTDPSHKLLRASAFAWGAPCIVLGILLSVAPHSYERFEVNNPSGTFCYPTGLPLWLTVFTPITLILISNATLFLLTVFSVFGKKRPPNHKVQSSIKEAFRCASVSLLLVFLFGLPWFFGLFSFNVICAFLFTIFVTFQGFMLFFFFVGNKNTRDLWFIKLKIRQAKFSGVNSAF